MEQKSLLIFVISLVIALGTATAQKCSARRLPMGPLLGPPGRDMAAGRDGLPGPPGSPGPSGVNFDELREIVRLMAKEELKNLTSEDREPVKVVVECDKLCPATDTTTSKPASNNSTQQPTTQPSSVKTYTPQPGSTQGNRSCGEGLTVNDPAMSCQHVLLCNSHLRVTTGFIPTITPI